MMRKTLMMRTPNPIELALILALAGCAVGPDYHRPQTPAPDDWRAWRSGADALAVPVVENGLETDWWKPFGDPLLDRLVERARAASPDVRTAALRFAQSRVQRSTVAAQRGVQVDAVGSLDRQRQSEHAVSTRLIDVLSPARHDELVGVLSEPVTVYQAGFDASWEADLWGRVARQLEAADARIAGSRAELQQVTLSVTAEVVRNYVELRAAQQQLRLGRARVAAASEALQLAQARVAGGLDDSGVAERRRAQLADAEAALPPWLAREAQAINQLTLLLGERPGALRTELADNGRSPGDWPRPDLALGVPSALLQRRPDIGAAEARLQAAVAEVGVAVADLYPRLTIGARFGLDSYQAGQFGDWGSREWSIGPSLTLPLFDQGRRRSTITLRKLEQQEAAVAYQQSVLGAWHDVDRALARYAAEQQRRVQLARTEAARRDELTLAQARQTGGMTDFLTVLDARSAQLQAQGARADSEAQLLLDLVAVYKSVGV